MMKLLKQILTLLLVAISTFINAQTPKLIASGTYKANGSGASGIPTVTIDIPAGKNRLMIISTFSERIHDPYNSNFVYNSDGATDGDYAHPIFVNDVSATYLSAPWTDKDLKKNKTTFFSTLNTVMYFSDAMGMPSGLATITFPGIKLPENSGDEMIVQIAIFENAKPNPTLLKWGHVRNFNTDTDFLTTDFLTVSGTTPTIPVGNSINNLVFFGTGGISQQNNVLFSSGWTTIQTDVMNNTNGTSSDLSSMSPNEHDGIGYTTAYRTISSGNPSFTLSRSASNLSTETASANLISILPMARPSVSGTVYIDNNGMTGGIDNGGTGGGTWNIANALYVNAVDTNGNVVATALVNTSGVFTFPSGGNLIEGDVVKFQLSKTQGTVGQPAPTKELPAGWAIVGESTTGGSSDGTPNGEFTLTIGTVNSTTNRFGVTACNAGASAPFVTTTITNTCPAITVNLNTAHTGTTPAGSSLVWFTNNTHTGLALSGTQVTQAGAGTYFAFYYDSVANCYSPASSAVIATINPCYVCPPDPYAAQQTWWLADGFNTPIHPVIIDFSTGSPIVSTPSTGYGNGYLSYLDLNGLGYEGNTTVTHPVTKQFLFATDGNTLFRGSDGVAATGTSVGGGKSAGEAAAVIPDPNGILGQSFLILGNTSWNSPGGLNMSKYDLVTNTLTNLTALLPNGTIYEGLEVIPHTNGNDYWILVNTTDQKVKSYLYTKASGFSATAVSSTDVANLSGVDPSYIAVNSFISWDPRTPGKLLIARHNKVGLANFDPSTGTLGTWDVKITYSTGSPENDKSVGYSVALSPNGRYIYYAGGYHNLMYYDLQTSTSSQLATVTSIRGVKIGPDNKLYVVGYPSYDTTGLYYYATPDSPSSSTSALQLLYTNGYTIPEQLPNNVYWGCITCQSGTAAPVLTNPTITVLPSTVDNLINLLTASNKPAGTAFSIHSDATATDANKLSSSTPLVAGTTYYISFYDGLAVCYSPTISIKIGETFCYKPAAIDADNTYPTKHGITALGRAGAKNDNWPMERQSAWTVLEAKTKGFVVNRVKFNTSNQPVADNGTTLVITNPVEGMMVYDTTNNCLKIYTLKEGDAAMAWHCMSTQTCPQ